MRVGGADEVRAVCDLGNMALHDIGYGTPLNVEDGRLLIPAGVVPRQVLTKARRLARLHLHGPDVLVACDAHDIANRADLWDRCRMVTVAEALLGHTCGAA